LQEGEEILKSSQGGKFLHFFQCKTNLRRKVFIDLTEVTLFLYSCPPGELAPCLNWPEGYRAGRWTLSK
jgi:hypothetical protein